MHAGGLGKCACPGYFSYMSFWFVLLTRAAVIVCKYCVMPYPGMSESHRVIHIGVHLLIAPVLL